MADYLLNTQKILKMYFCPLIVLLTIGISIGLFRFEPIQAAPTVDLILSPVADTLVASGYPDESFGTLRRIWVGYDSSGGFQAQRALLLFDISDIPNYSQIDSAELLLYLDSTTRNAADMPISIYPIAPGSFSPSPVEFEAITWNAHQGMERRKLVDSQSIATGFMWYSWNLRPLLQALTDSADAQYMALVLQGNETVGQHERGFWAKDCSDSECGAAPGLRPKVVINYTAATPTPTSTATPTAMPTPTPTITPGIHISLHNILITEEESEADIEYRIDYQSNGSDIVQNVRIINFIPDGVECVTVSQGGECVNQTVIWDLEDILNPDEFQKSVSYTVKRLESEQTEISPTITNHGAYVYWDYESQFGLTNRSNSVYYPKFDIYLSLVRR